MSKKRFAAGVAAVAAAASVFATSFAAPAGARQAPEGPAPTIRISAASHRTESTTASAPDLAGGGEA
jgi:hypothetical protein